MVSGNLGTPFLLSPFPFFALRNEKKKAGGGGGGGGEGGGGFRLR